MKVTPVGRDPLSDRPEVGIAGRGHGEGTGRPSVKVVLSAEVMAGAASTVRVKDWVAAGLTPLAALMVMA